MKNEPVSISTLMRPVRIPTAAKAPVHADRPIAIGDGFAVLGFEADTTQIPRNDKATIARLKPVSTTGELSRSRVRSVCLPIRLNSNTICRQTRA